jgi:hypothetical protein
MGTDRPMPPNQVPGSLSEIHLFIIFNYLEFIARVTSHIPDKEK